ncbi:MAG: twin-arginine translocation signal domain-containing protein [Verrucomicrobiales bacterium]
MPNRRSFIKTSAASAAALGSSRLLIAQQSEPKNAVIGEGSFKYECLHYWGALPEGHNYGGATHGVALDSEGLVYITHQGGPGSIFVFDPQGKFVRSLAPEHQGEGHGIDVRREGSQDFLYLSPNSFQKPHACEKMTTKGEVVWQKGPPPESHKYDDGKGFNSTNISFSPDGGFHVGDGYGRHFIHRYDKEANYVSSFGGAGSGPGQFKTPHGHWLDVRDGIPKICVCDRANDRLQFVSLDGQHLSFLPGFAFPASAETKGDLLLIAELKGGIALLDKSNKVVARLGDDPEWRAQINSNRISRSTRDKWLPGRFVHPHDAAFDKEGNIYVAEWVAGGRVTKMRKVS